MFLTCPTSIQLNSHRDVTSPSPWVNTNVTRQNWRIDGVRDNAVTVTVSLEVLQTHESVQRFVVEAMHIKSMSVHTGK